MLPEIKGVFRTLPPAVGYAVTGVISAVQPEGRNVSREDWWDLIVSVPEPRFIVLHDIDNPPLGAYWGEVQGNIHKALGAVGVATDGTVRDIDEVESLGFQFFAKEISASHAYVHLVEIGIPVTVGGLTVQDRRPAPRRQARRNQYSLRNRRADSRHGSDHCRLRAADHRSLPVVGVHPGKVEGSSQDNPALLGIHAKPFPLTGVGWSRPLVGFGDNGEGTLMKSLPP